jgi:transcriptional regulator with XRE-family HTH domain
MSSTLGTFIQSRLDALNLKQADLVRCSELSRTYISMLTTGSAPTSKRASYLPEPDKLTTLAQCLQCSQSELLVAMGYLPPQEARDPIEARILEGSRRLPQGVRDVVAIIVNSLDLKYGEGRERATHSGVLDPNDPRQDTIQPTSAADLTPQGEQTAEEKRHGNGER